MIYVVLACLTAIALLGLPPHWSMLLGVMLSLTLAPSPLVQKHSKPWSARLLQLSIVLLGAGLNFQSVLKEGTQGLIITFMSITAVFAVGALLAALYRIPAPLSTLITTGTSICGGSAISAISPILKADGHIMATALGIVFILNGIAVFVFPPVAHFFQLTQVQFGTWAALAIHDTSSVVAASQIYGEEALKVGTTLKLTRALWIIPLSILFATLKKSENKISIPWFILLFLLVSLIFTFFPVINFLIPYFTKISKTGFSVTLFLIGLSLNKDRIREIGVRPIFFGITLWLLTTLGSFFYVWRI